jgi:hypothetical protein
VVQFVPLMRRATGAWGESGGSRSLACTGPPALSFRLPVLPIELAGDVGMGPIQASVGFGAEGGGAVGGLLPVVVVTSVLPAGVRPCPGSGSVTVKKLECSKQVTYNLLAGGSLSVSRHHDEYISMG